MGLREDFEKLKRERPVIAKWEAHGDLAWIIYQAASLASAEKVKEEAARVSMREAEGYKEHRLFPAALAALECEKAIRAIDVKKLLEQGGV